MEQLKSRTAARVSILFFFLLFSVNAQTLNSFVNINPYPSPYMSDWEINPASLGSMTIINSSADLQSVRIRVNLLSKGKGLLFKGVSNEILLNTKAPTIIDNTLLTDFYKSEFPDKNFKDKVIQSGRLPEGTYTACFDILDMRSLVIDDNICANFTIVYPQPPQLIYPESEGSILSTNTNPVFQWTPVNVPLDFGVTYTLKIVELIEGQNPYQAIQANVPHLLEEGITTSSFTYPSYGLPLSAGKTYVWQVQALDYLGIPPTQNDGKSEIFTFSVNSISVLPNLTIVPALVSPGDTVFTKTPTFTWNYSGDIQSNNQFRLKVVKIEGKQPVEYAFRNNTPLVDEKFEMLRSSYKPPKSLSLNNNTNYAWRVELLNKKDGSVIASSAIRKFIYHNPTTFTIFPPITFSNSSVTGILNYEFADPGEWSGWALPNVNIKLVVKYVLKYSSNTGNMYYGNNQSSSGEIVLPESSTKYFAQDDGKVLATTKTDTQGNFSFTFIDSDSMGIAVRDYTFSGSGEYRYIYEGDVYRVARIYIETPHKFYYTNPDNNLIVEPGKTLNTGNIFTYVRSYRLILNVKSHANIENQALPKNSPISGMRVYLLRKNRPYAVPSNEVMPPKSSPGDPILKMLNNNYEVVGIDSTDHMGVVEFKRVVQSINSNDKYYVFTESSPKSLYNYTSLFPVSFRFYDTNDEAVFNSDYNYFSRTFTVNTFPINPYIKGVVKRSDTKQPISGVQVRIKNSRFSFSSEASMLTAPDGKFNFTNLKNEFDNNGNATGPLRYITFFKSGYVYRILDVPENNSVLKPGDKWQKEIYLEPRAVVSGKVVTEFGGGINALVRVGEGPVVQANVSYSFSYGRGITLNPAEFESPAITSPQSQKIVITPLNNMYAPESTYVVINSNEQDLGTFKVYKKRHKIIVNVREKVEGQIPFNWPAVEGAIVRLKLPSGDLVKTSQALGVVMFEFDNDGTSFDIEIKAPKGKYYETLYTTINNTISKNYKTYLVGMKKATFISGKVYVNNTPIKDASVFIDRGSSSPNIGTKSRADGSYILPNVPIAQQLTVWASKNSKDSTLVGDSTKIIAGESGLTNVDLYLSVYEGMDITKLLGFPIEVTVMNVNGEDISISGRFIKYPSNEAFEVDTTYSELSFTNVKIVPSESLTSQMYGREVPVAAPASLPVKTNSNSLDFKVYEHLAGEMKDKNIGVHLIDPGAGIGVISGKMTLNPNSFNTSGSLSELDNLYLKIPGSNSASNMLIPALSADGILPSHLSGGFLISDPDGNDLKYKLNNFSAVASADSSTLFGDTLKLKTTISADIQNVGNVSINLGNVVIHHNSIESIQGNRLIKIPLDLWTINGEEWIFNHGDFRITKGYINTGSFQVPINKLQLSPNQIAYSELDLNSINIGGIIPLNVKTNLTLGYDNSISQWFLIGSDVSSYAASFGGLPGMAPQDSVYLEAISLYSKSKGITLTPKSAQDPLKIYEVGIFTPDQIAVVEAKNYVELTSLSFDIPKVSTLNAHIQYYKEGGQIKFRLVPVNIKFNSHGVNANFAFEGTNYPMYLDEKGMRARGTVSEDGKFSLNSWLYHTKDSTSIRVETPHTPYLSATPTWQKLSIGQNLTYFDKITGGMIPANQNDWNNFKFAGDLIVPKGIKDGQNRMNFDVIGEIKANNQQLGVDNIPTAFGGMKWTYEIENNRLIGNMHFEKVLSGDAFTKGDANCVVDNDGWYFASGGTFTMKNPSYSGNACLVFGDHQMTDEIMNIIKANSWIWLNKNALPAGFPNRVNGFYFEGGFAMPIPIIPEFDFDFGLVSARLSHSLGSDIFMDMQFGDEANSYGTGFAIYGNISLGLGGSVVLSCAGVSASVTADLLMRGYYYSSGEWFVEGDQSVTLTGTTYAGWGICDSNCEGIDSPVGGDTCDKETKSGSVNLGVKTHYGTDDKFFEIYLK